MRHETIGVVMMIGSCVIWGLSPLYYKLLSHLAPFDILSHRVAWSAVFFLIWLGLQRRLGALRPLFAPRVFPFVALAAVMIWINWFVFISAVGAGRVTEASLGYYIFPLVSVVFGAVIFGERLARLQWAAVALAALAVGVLTIGLGVAPYVSLILAVSFGLYGVLKKQVQAGPVVSVTAEVLIALPVALWALGVHLTGEGAALSARDLGLLMLSGPLTAMPLVLFAGAAKRIALTTVGLLQYLNPSLQFLCAVVIFGEPLGLWHAITFPMIWLALALYSAVALAAERKRARAPSTS